MNCDDFERWWAARMDEPSARLAHPDPAVLAHAESCPACRTREAGFERLSRALRAWEPPAAPAGLAERVLAAWAHRPAPRRWASAPARQALLLASAAALLAASVIGLRGVWIAGRPPAPREVVARESVRPLADSLADATSATLELAWATSEPAARVGLGVIDGALRPEERLNVLALPLPSESPSRALRGVGHRMQAGAAVFSGSIRQAFGLRIGASDPEPDPRPGPAGPAGEAPAVGPLPQPPRAG